MIDRYYRILKLLTKRWLIIGVFVCIIDAFFFVAQQYMQKIAIDYLSVHSTWNKVQIVLLFLVITYFGTSILFFTNGLLFRFLSFQIQKKLIEKVYEFFYKLPLWKLKEFHIGEQMKIFSTIEEIANDFFNLPYKLEVLVKCFFVYSLIFYMNVQIAILLLPFGFLYFILISLNKKKLERYNQKIVRLQFERMRNLEDGISGIRELVTYHALKWYVEIICNIQDRFLHTFQKKKIVESFGIAGNISFSWGITYIFLIIGGNLLTEEKMSIGEFTLCYFLVNLFISFISEIYSAIISCAEGGSRIKKIEMFIEAKEIPTISYKVVKQIETLELENVYFNYLTEEKSIFENINLCINRKKHKIIVITGESGSGKSTLLRIFLGEYQLTSGTYLVNKSSYDQIEVDKFFGIVDQNAKLFSGSIYDNIRFGRDNIAKEQIELMCEKMYIHDFIMQLPGNYNYHVGTKAINFSGGQRKRMILARALLGEKDVLLIDEGMAGIDENTESEIWKNIFSLRQNKVTIIITHKKENIPKWDLEINVNNKNIHLVDEWRTLNEWNI